MKIANCLVTLESDHPDVREAESEKGCVWVGVPNASYRIRIKNLYQDHRVFTAIKVDGVDPMPGYGLIIEPQGGTVWDGFRDEGNDEQVRAFIFFDGYDRSVAVAAGTMAQIGRIEVTICREGVSWSKLQAWHQAQQDSRPLLMAFSTGKGNLIDSCVRQVKIEFQWGLDRETAVIQYGSADEFKAAGVI